MACSYWQAVMCRSASRLLAPVIVNILAFHIFLLPAGAQMAILVTICWIIAFITGTAVLRRPLVQK